MGLVQVRFYFVLIWSQVFQLRRFYIERDMNGCTRRELFNVLLIRPFRYFLIGRINEVLQTFLVFEAMRQMFSIFIRCCACCSYVTRDFAVSIWRVEMMRIDLRLTGMAVVFVCTTFIQDETESFMASNPFARRANNVSIIFRGFQ